MAGTKWKIPTRYESHSRRNIFRTKRKAGIVRNTYEQYVLPAFALEGGSSLFWMETGASDRARSRTFGLGPPAMGRYIRRMTLNRKRNLVSGNPHAVVELSPRCAMVGRCARGYVVDISGNFSANETTPYLLAVASRIVRIRGGESEFRFSWVWGNTYTANFITSVDVPIRDGAPIFGIVIPAIGE